MADYAQTFEIRQTRPVSEAMLSFTINDLPKAV